MTERVYMMVMAMIQLMTLYKGMCVVPCYYPVAMLLIKKYDERIGHVKGGKEFKEGLLPHGAKLLRCKLRNGRWGYKLSCYSWDSGDGIKVLKELWIEKFL